jgi:hypothetical protein
MKQSLTDRLLTIFGDLKIFHWPFWLVYDPGSYAITGDDVRQMLATLQPGDVLLRGFYGYLDAKFIPGTFSHAALYCGELKESDRPKAGLHPRKPGATSESRSTPRWWWTKSAKRAYQLWTRPTFRPGPQMVIQALAEGVNEEDILTFCRCDELAILRLPEIIRATVPEPQAPGVPLRFFNAEEEKVDQALASSGTVDRATVVELAIDQAIKCIGRGYDFDFSITNFSHLYCSELVYFCLKSVQRFSKVRPQMTRIAFFDRRGIIPDAFLTSGLELVWRSASVVEELPALGVPVAITP